MMTNYRTTSFRYISHRLAIVLLLFCTACIHPAVAQKRVIDSLKEKIAHGKDDTAKVNTLTALATQLKSNAPELAMQYATEALVLANKLKYEDGIGRAKLNQALVMMNLGKNDSALILLHEAKVIFIKTKNKKLLANTYNNIGLVHKYEGEYSKSLSYQDSALRLRLEIKDIPGTAGSWNNIGIIYQDLGNYTRAMECYFKALKLKQQAGDRKGEAYSLANIGTIYLFQKDDDNALKYLKMSLKIREDLNETNGIAFTLGVMGSVYSEKGMEDSAMYCYFKALEIQNRLGNPMMTANTEGNIGELYLHLEDYTHALEHFERARQLYIAANNRNGESQISTAIADIQILKGQFAAAKKNIDHAILLAKTIGHRSDLATAYETYSHYDLAVHHDADALAHYKLHIQYKDSLNNEEAVKKTTRMAMQFDFDRRSAADSIKNAEKIREDELKHQQEIEQGRTYVVAATAGALLTLLVAIVSLVAYRQKRRSNLIIMHQKEIVEEKQREIIDSIRYARRIQQSLLPKPNYISRKLNELRSGEDHS